MSDKKDKLSVPENSIMVGLALVDDGQLAMVRLENLEDDISETHEDIIQAVTLGMLFMMKYGFSALHRIGEADLTLARLMNEGMDIEYNDTVVPFDTSKH